MTRWREFFLLAGLCVSAVCQAASTLEVAPETVQLCPGGSQSVRVTAKTDAPSASLENTVVQWRAPAGVTVSLDPAVQVTPKTSGTYAAWMLQATAPNGLSSPDMVHVFLLKQAPKSPLQVLASTSFKVQSAISGDAFPVKVELLSSWKSVNEGQRARFTAVVTSQSGVPLAVTGMRVRAAPFSVGETDAPDDPNAAGGTQASDSTKAIAPASATGPQGTFDLPLTTSALAPGSAMTRAFDVFVADSASPSASAHELQLAVDVTGSINGCQRAVTLFASKELGFEVLGNEALLTTVGIPTFLLVPGFLFLMGMVLLWKLGLRPKRVAPNAAFPFPPKEAEFWVVAIAVSLLLLFIPHAASRFANYRIEFVSRVWFGSLLASALVYSIAVLVINRWDAWRSSKLLSANESAPEALVKLLKLSRSTLLPLIQVDQSKVTGVTVVAPRLLAKRVAGPAWTIPPIVYDWTGDPDEQTQGAIQAARTAKDLSQLAKTLFAALKLQLITLEWDPKAQPRRPLQLDAGTFTENGEVELIREKE